ncbi:DUF4249 family protein [Reichenbachiella agariperforans]|uniref:DUF4249 family protein n=1 Tax=Reichenbachiella agariperforans TaxID=156994 RepID=UPI001C07F8CA|nr:DUF4249 family protein [Reichenbachiella agariperforans]MBU2915947.1 DUF4249 domain-containing protein [Reichenbachiella agariperforans]
MVSRHGWVVLVFMCWACDFNRELETPYIEPHDQYFVECYMRPDELYNLTATEVSPIFEEYILDYSLDFDVYIIDQDTVELRQSLFVEPETGYIYNYGSGRRLPENIAGVSMLVISPTRDTIRAYSRVPEQILLDTAFLIHNQVNISFYTSEDSEDNYYIYYLNYDVLNHSGAQIKKSEVAYLDFHDYSERVLKQSSLSGDSLDYADEVQVTLMRVTRENFLYQRSLQDAKNASKDNVTYPAPLEGNIENGVGIFTCYTEDIRRLVAHENVSGNSLPF